MLEDAIPSGTKAGTARGLPPRDVLEYLGQGELQLSSLKLGKQERKVHYTMCGRVYEGTHTRSCDDGDFPDDQLMLLPWLQPLSKNSYIQHV